MRKLFVSYAYQIISTENDRCSELDNSVMIEVTEERAKWLAKQATIEGNYEYFLHNCSDLR
jgi:hypothetical protein